MDKSMTASAKRIRIICTVTLMIVGMFCMVPLLWVVLNSFKTNLEFQLSYSNITDRMSYLKAVLPASVTLENYIQLFTGESLPNASHIDTMIINSLAVSLSQTVIVLVITSLSTFAYERLNFPAGNTIFWTLFFLSLIPNTISILPLFKICHAMGWVNDINALIWPNVTGVMNIFLLKNFMKSIPKEMDEAARIDGAGSFQIYRLVILPSMKPVMMVVALFAFRHAWNDYLWPTIVMNNPKSQTLTSGLALLAGQYETGQWTHLLASTVISMLPPLLLYFTSQRYFLQGISVQASVKG